MGIYDRDYSRSQPGSHGSILPETIVMRLVLLNIAIYLVQIFSGDFGKNITAYLSVHGDTWKYPLSYYQFLTNGFLHSPREIQHVLFNMFGLWFFGRDIEYRYGRKEFLTFYLAAIVLASVGWMVVTQFSVPADKLYLISALGASGGVVAVIILNAFNWPHRVIYIWGILPVPMWGLAAFMIGTDIFGAVGRVTGSEALPWSEKMTAFSAHLFGALFAACYFQFHWNLTRFLPGSMKMPKRKPKLKVHRPEEDKASKIDSKVDDILQKIQEHGQESLSAKERKILEDASREYQKRNQ